MAPVNIFIVAISWSFSALFVNVDDESRPSFCGLTPYDFYPTVSLHEKYSLDYSEVPYLFRKKHFDIVKPRLGLTRLKKLEMLKTKPFPIRMRVLFDTAFEAEFNGRKSLETFIRNMFLSAQMVYEQPEMFDQVKMYFVITKLERMRFDIPPSMSANEILYQVEELQGPTYTDRYDITFLLLFSNIFEETRGPKSTSLLGMSNVGSFCNPAVRQRALLFKSNSLNIGIVIAHEFAHSLNVQHDGSNNEPERSCPNDFYIMGPVSGIGRDRWSHCSVAAVQSFLIEDDIFECVYDKRRFETQPLNERFDFSPNSTQKLPLPGLELDANRQCQIAFDPSVKSEPVTHTDICKQLYCNVDGVLIGPGPALPGTKCNKTYSKPATSGSCSIGDCV